MPTLEILDFSVLVHLGCSAPERKMPQEVRVSVRLELKNRPRACLSDRLEDALCYAKICEVIREISMQKEYETIEHLSESIGIRIFSLVEHEASVRLRIHKLKPPIDGLIGGVSFEEEWLIHE